MAIYEPQLTRCQKCDKPIDPISGAMVLCTDHFEQYESDMDDGDGWHPRPAEEEDDGEEPT